MRAIDINTEARAKAQAAFPVGATVRLKHGAYAATVIGHTSKGGIAVEFRVGQTETWRADQIEVLP